eukprot:TRINITY_DN12821_c0_g4_i1.p2 TRINITY_DN12821_c0_g4~~TRINITY_DN12821_c0_g4_i1.p2  ORF type:complete len:183 (+),score=58.60 TRINITY_DN12821_c0_g4_i1:964-1512(+)
MRARQLAGLAPWSKLLLYVSAVDQQQANECYEQLKHRKEMRKTALRIETSACGMKERDMNERGNVDSSIRNITQMLTALNDKSKSIANLLQRDCVPRSTKSSHNFRLKRVDNSIESGRLIADELKESLQSVQKLKSNLASITAADRKRQKENKACAVKGENANTAVRKKELLRYRGKESSRV